MPASISTTSNVQTLERATFQFNAIGTTCDILKSAFTRYFNIMFDEPSGVTEEQYSTALKFSSNQNQLDKLDVNVMTPCDLLYPSFEMNESCEYHAVILVFFGYQGIFAIFKCTTSNYKGPEYTMYCHTQDK